MVRAGILYCEIDDDYYCCLLLSSTNNKFSKYLIHLHQNLWLGQPNVVVCHQPNSYYHVPKIPDQLHNYSGLHGVTGSCMYIEGRCRCYLLIASFIWGFKSLYLFNQLNSVIKFYTHTHLHNSYTCVCAYIERSD